VFFGSFAGHQRFNNPVPERTHHQFHVLGKLEHHRLVCLTDCRFVRCVLVVHRVPGGLNRGLVQRVLEVFDVRFVQVFVFGGDGDHFGSEVGFLVLRSVLKQAKIVKTAIDVYSRAMVITATQAKDQLASLLERARTGNERIVIEKHGKPAAVLVSLEDLKRLERLDSLERAALHRPLSGTVTRFDDPFGSVSSEDWLSTDGLNADGLNSGGAANQWSCLTRIS
jgi:prevent-host-death family protein